MRCALLTSLVILVGCAPSPGGDAGSPTRDAGRRDAGSRDAGPSDAGPTSLDSGPSRDDCGGVTQMCCAAGPRCDTGATCEGDACCASPGGAECTGPEQCCGDNDCVGGKCCALQTGSCRSASDCCADLLCADEVCLLPFTECGREGQACCADDACRSGLECAGGMCEPCGGSGEICCRPPAECGADLSCTAGRCGAPDPTCGGDGQACCAGDRCDGELACTTGTCAPPAVTCGYADCGECTLHYPCGWCDGLGCVEGTSSGPDGSACTDWSWLSGDCGGAVDSCADATDCGDCTSRSGCGWCGEGADSCQGGSSRGPTAGSCGAWDWLPSECGGAACSTYADCGACTGGSSCGWCDDTGACSSGSSTGPDTGACTGWSWLAFECSAPDPCAGEAACGGCTAQSGCGWCNSDSTCASGAAGGPTDGTCADWDFGAASCVCSMVQGMCSTATDCCTGLSCRRGVSFGVRCCVEATGTCAAGGDCCGYMDCNAGACVCRTSGRGCLEDADCCSGTCTTGRCA